MSLPAGGPARDHTDIARLRICNLNWDAPVQIGPRGELARRANAGPLKTMPHKSRAPSNAVMLNPIMTDRGVHLHDGGVICGARASVVPIYPRAISKGVMMLSHANGKRRPHRAALDVCVRGCVQKHAGRLISCGRAKPSSGPLPRVVPNMPAWPQAPCAPAGQDQSGLR